MKIVYTILHFNTFEITCRCIDSILKLSNSYIVVVDNGSSNDSGKVIKIKYENFSRVIVLQSEKNFGFARGNNIGYDYAKNILNADVIIDCNNDLIFNDKDFEQNLINMLLNKKNIGVIAPNIVNSDGKQLNPLNDEGEGFFLLCKHLLSYSFLYCISYNATLHECVTKKIGSKQQVNYTGKQNNYDILPHGSCVIFTKEFIDKSKVAFLPITFMYREEFILYDYLKTLNLRTLYVDSLGVFHEGGVSTRHSYADKLVKCRFSYKCTVCSIFNHIIFLIKNKLFNYNPYKL